jgi:hypothetical protein
MHSGYNKRRRVVSVEVKKEVDIKDIVEVDTGAFVTKDMVEEEIDPPLVLIIENLVMYQGFLPNHTCVAHTTIVPSMSLKTIVTC